VASDDMMIDKNLSIETFYVEYFVNGTHAQHLMVNKQGSNITNPPYTSETMT
jgi:hypothetical protein